MTTTSRAARIWAGCACARSGMRPNITAAHVSAPKTINALKHTDGFIFFSPQVGGPVAARVRKSLFGMDVRVVGNERVIPPRNGAATADGWAAGFGTIRSE